MAVRTYDFKKVSLIVGGNIISGFAEGSGITVEYDEDAWTLHKGADGEGARAKSNNDSGTITFSLMQTANSNDILTGLFEIDRLTNGGAVSTLIKDGSGRSIHMAETAWIQKLPSSGYLAEIQEREWVLRTDKLSSTIGGNN